jgi:hypothetical protein
MWSNLRLVKFDQWSNLTTGQISNWSNPKLVKTDQWSNSPSGQIRSVQGLSDFH